MKHAVVETAGHEIEQGFTPGPWRTTYSQERQNFMVVASDGHGRIAQCMERSDAHLTAAAPALYSAAMSALVYMQSRGDLGTQGKAVVNELISALTAAAE